ncbi:phosphate ABC transporter ATP-binding protein PstB [Shimazuella sp. AN120528]|uniref:phosphate ABC transporter ATP-binding protein PstB n=1 Tax=Shimazuella soli TaxID=1892854 RepID=UPI001F0E1373|nr:phosphate ABC transporter ATP-binding protein PstB [Shimazuella soli]MCH5584372.1 phosphate ABC transporter ATP-binding protein PstB [Shimazuella soli]
MLDFPYVKKRDADLSTNVTVKTNKLNVYYGSSHALKDINITLYDKTITAFIGPSGCGKSTLLRSINRMNDTIPGAKITGDIFIDGVNIQTESIQATALRKHVGMVFQKPNPFFKSIFENIAFALRIHGVSKKDIEAVVEESLKRVGLWDEVKDRLQDSALQLSGGQQQRLCIARTIAMNPSIILLDEPTSALDPISTEKIEQLLQELKRDFTIVIVTHNMHQAARISDYTAYFHLGNMVEIGHTEQIFTAPQQSRTHDYLSGKFG